MRLKNGVWQRGPIPSSGSGGPRIVTHSSQRTYVSPSGSRMDNLLEGNVRVCVLRRLGGLGDIIMATPIARGVKRKFPKSHVTYAVPTDYAQGGLVQLLANNPFIDEIIDYKLAVRDDYDSFTDITRVGLSDEKSHTQFPNRIDLFAKACSIPLYGNFLPVYIPTPEEDSWGRDWIERTKAGKSYRAVIGIHIRSNDPKRTWPAYRVREFVDLARREGYFSLLFGWGDSEDEWRLGGSAQVFNYQTRQAAAILKHCDLLVCPDSALLHLGGALNMKMVSLFGSMPPGSRINHYPNCIAVVNQQLSCLGCVYARCDNAHYCMSSLLPHAVLAAVENQLKAPQLEGVVEEDSAPEAAPGPFVHTINTFLM